MRYEINFLSSLFLIYFKRKRFDNKFGARFGAPMIASSHMTNLKIRKILVFSNFKEMFMINFIVCWDLKRKNYSSLIAICICGPIWELQISFFTSKIHQKFITMWQFLKRILGFGAPNGAPNYEIQKVCDLTFHRNKKLTSYPTYLWF